MFSKLRIVLIRIFRLARLAILGPKAWGGVFIYFVILALNFLGVWVSIQFIDWNKKFFDALENLDASAAFRQIGIFFALIALSAGSWLIANWLRKKLLIIWRERLTAKALDLWLGERGYWVLRPDYGVNPIENPDQRIAEDCRKFIELFLTFTLDLISQTVALFTLASVLWSLSTFTLQFTVLGTAIAIPNYMFWLAPVYVLCSFLITHWLGHPLKGLYFKREQVEADFRHSLINLRDNADHIVQAQGEAGERRRIDKDFREIKENWRQLIRRELIYGIFNRTYFQTVLRMPTFFALPAYFAGQVTLGGLMQLASAFSQVVTTLSWFIFNYSDLAEYVAVTERLDELFANTKNPKPLQTAVCNIQRKTSPDAALHITDLVLTTPNGKQLAPVPDFVIQPKDRVWIRGASGQGKTTLASALIGIWPWGEGRIEKPEYNFSVIPSGAPVFSEGLIEAACYPHDPKEYDQDRIHEVLNRLGLGARLNGDATDVLVSGLSMGERQRVGLARAVLQKPKWLIMDEATSALNSALEEDLLDWLNDELAESTLLIISHREPFGLKPDKIWNIGVNPADS